MAVTDIGHPFTGKIWYWTATWNKTNDSNTLKVIVNVGKEAHRQILSLESYLSVKDK